MLDGEVDRLGRARAPRDSDRRSGDCREREDLSGLGVEHDDARADRMPVANEGVDLLLGHRLDGGVDRSAPPCDHARCPLVRVAVDEQLMWPTPPNAA